MSETVKTPDAIVLARKGALRLRIIAVVILFVGIAAAELVYWRGNRQNEFPDDASMIGYDKAATRQAGALYGQQGVLVQAWSEDLQRPGTEAAIIITGTVLFSGACIYFAKLVEKRV